MMMSLEVLGLQMICMHLVMLDLMSDAVLEPAIPRVNCCFTWYMSVESIVVVVVKCENPGPNWVTFKARDSNKY